MKPGLLDYLACPICKHWPIKLWIFNFETENTEFETVLNNPDDLNMLQNLTKIIRGKNKVEKCVNIEENKIQDDLVRYKLTFDEYIKKFDEVMKNIDYITLMTNGAAQNIHEKVKEIYNEFHIAINKNEKELKDFIEKEINKIYISNWYFQRVEVEDGIMKCDKCKRWYPISDSIPQMLPDNLRVKKDELRFLEKWKDLIPKEILEEGIPFNLKNDR